MESMYIMLNQNPRNSVLVYMSRRPRIFSTWRILPWHITDDTELEWVKEFNYSTLGCRQLRQLRWKLPVLAEIDNDEYDKDIIVTKIMAVLYQLMKKNNTDTAYQAFDDSIKYRRFRPMKIEKYIVEFNQLYNGRSTKCPCLKGYKPTHFYNALTCR